MKILFPKPIAVTLPLLILPVAATAQQSFGQGPWFFTVEGLYARQDGADLDNGGSFSVDRAFLQAGVTYRFDGGRFAGLSFSAGQQDYDFDTPGAAPWGRIEDYAVSAIYRARTGGVSWFVAPTLRYDFEEGADRSDGETYGLFAGVSWEVSDRLTIGPAFGAFSEIGEDGITAFPALLIDWEIADRWTLSTGPTIGASRGPGLTLSYAATDDINIALSGRYEEQRFALNDEGLAPDGVGEDRSFPLVLSVGYAPNPGFAVNAFAGAELGGRVRLEDASGALVSEEDYDPAPIFGLQARFSF